MEEVPLFSVQTLITFWKSGMAVTPPITPLSYPSRRPAQPPRIQTNLKQKKILLRTFFEEIGWGRQVTSLLILMLSWSKENVAMNNARYPKIPPNAIQAIGRDQQHSFISGKIINWWKKWHSSVLCRNYVHCAQNLNQLQYASGERLKTIMCRITDIIRL